MRPILLALCLATLAGTACSPDLSGPVLVSFCETPKDRANNREFCRADVAESMGADFGQEQR